MAVRVVKRHKPKNTNWGKPLPLTEVYGPHRVSEFDQLVAKMRLTPEEYVSSTALKMWVKKNRTRRYVPEFLLVAWDMEVSYEDFNVTI